MNWDFEKPAERRLLPRQLCLVVTLDTFFLFRLNRNEPRPIYECWDVPGKKPSDHLEKVASQKWFEKVGVVERRQALPILANVLIKAENKTLSMTATDLEVELISSTQLSSPVAQPIQLTVPAHKLLDICKTLPDGSVIDFKASSV